MNSTTKAIATIFIATLLSSTTAHAQMLDDMTCYKAKAGVNFSHAAIDLEALDPTIGDSARCTLKKNPTKICVPSSAQITETDGERWATSGDELHDYYVCYKLQCADGDAPDMRKTDQFGSHELSGPRTSEICVPASLEYGDGGEEPANMAGITLTHNNVRATVPGTSDPLPPLQWNSYLEDGASAHARNCRYRHGSSRERGGAGENIYANQEPGLVTAVQVADTWASERYVYEYPSGICTGFMCGHYTQMVWRETQNLGCAVQVCNTGNPFGLSSPWEFWVCRYDPGGNTKGRLPY